MDTSLSLLLRATRPFYAGFMHDYEVSGRSALHAVQRHTRAHVVHVVMRGVMLARVIQGHRLSGREL